MSEISLTSSVQLRGEMISYPISDEVYTPKVLSVHHYTNRLFKFRISRPKNFRFRSGEFSVIGLPLRPQAIYRGYSIASPFWDRELEFLSTKVPNGSLTEHLHKIEVGDTIFLYKKARGSLTIDALLPGKRLYLFSTGTGIAPFASLIRDPETYEKFEHIILVQATRDLAELAYAKEICQTIREDALIGKESHKLQCHFRTTREPSPHMGRLTEAINSGHFFEETGLPAFCPEEDRLMVCGSVEMLKSFTKICEDFGLIAGTNHRPGSFVIEWDYFKNIEETEQKKKL